MKWRWVLAAFVQRILPISKDTINSHRRVQIHCHNFHSFAILLVVFRPSLVFSAPPLNVTAVFVHLQINVLVITKDSGNLFSERAVALEFN